MASQSHSIGSRALRNLPPIQAKFAETNARPRRPSIRTLDLNELRGKRVLIFASTGGHLTQAIKWADRLEVAHDSTFVTFENRQSLSLLANRPHVFVPYVPPRDWRTMVQAAGSLFRQRRNLPAFDAVFSTGAGFALVGLPFALRRWKPVFYVESVSRYEGPSLTGRVLQGLPGVRLFTQHPGYSRWRWRRVDSLIADYESTPAEPGESIDPAAALSIFVTLGTIRPYRFDRLVEMLRPALRPEDTVLWQLGETERGDLPGRATKHLSAPDFDDALKTYDVIVTHAGVGTLMAILDAGRLPVVAPRLAEYDEHVDDHQMQVAAHLESLSLVQVADTTISRDMLIAAANTRVRQRDPSWA